jgi:phenylalanyl-tRNA synthetase alpha chain
VLKPGTEAYATEGSPEAQVWAAVPPGPEGISLTDLKAAVPGEAGDLGFRQAMQQK